MLAWYDIASRLTAAVVLGGLVGLNRDLHHKPSGLRTLAIVSLGASVAMMTVLEGSGQPGEASRVMQGLLTGVGFLGAGVIVHDASTNKVHGLTTAAAIWVTAVVGASCGLGQWPLVSMAGLLLWTIIMLGGRIEKKVHRYFDGSDKGDLIGSAPVKPARTSNDP